MADNPYTREANVQMVELVPNRDRLPTCRAIVFRRDDTAYICGYKVRYLVNDNAVCGHHAGAGNVFAQDRKPKGKVGKRFG